MHGGVLIPVICQAEHCDRQNWMQFERRGWYAFCFPANDYNKHQMRITRSKEDIDKEIRRVRCEICDEETMVFLMMKASALKFQKIAKDLVMVEPGKMRLPGEEIQPLPAGLPLVRSPDFIAVELE